jgi:DNA ligase (NAD+)
MTDTAGLTEADFVAAVDQAQAAAKSYYDTGDVLMTDADYDAVLDRIAEAKRAHPDWDDRGVRVIGPPPCRTCAELPVHADIDA